MQRVFHGEEDEREDGEYPGGGIDDNSPIFKGDDASGGGDVGAGGDFDPGGNRETPRERAGNTVPAPNVTSAPRKPTTPDIGAGSVEEHSNDGGNFTSQPSGLPIKDFGDSRMRGGVPEGGWTWGGGEGQAALKNLPPAGKGGTPSGVVPFQPMGSPRGPKSTLFGMAGGLKGGGLGVPSIGGGESDSSSLIDSLMSILKQKKGGMF